ncbi:hypothetical protein FACS1894137_12660 [Spirochaetia bacterium]|nr:hypothetical protein FACS1894137_12660 [Spirochaetia bacterium]
MTESNNPEDFPIFKHLDQATIIKMLRKIESFLGNLSVMLNIETTKIGISMPIMTELIERVEKRRIYFHIFHDRCKMGELNEGALICFWVLKLHPFFCKGMETSELNAKIALCYLTNIVYYCQGKDFGKRTAIPAKLLKEIYYSFKYRDMSKEAIMLLATSLLTRIK